jgi:hypothetical protein
MDDVVRIAPLVSEPGLIGYECPACSYVTSVLLQPLKANPKADMSPSRPDPDRSRQWHASHQRTHPFVRDHDGSADHVGGALLTSGASKASFPPLCKDHGDLRSLSGSPSAMNDLFNRVRGAVGQRHGLTDARNGQKVAGLFGID